MWKTLSKNEKYGEISINLQKESYSSEEILIGNCIVHIKSTINSKKILFKIQGKEKVRVWNQLKIKEKIFEEELLLENRAGNFTVGTHIIPFSFKLPPKLPGSFSYDFKVMGQKCEAKVKYKIKAALIVLKSEDNDCILNKKTFLIK